MNLVTGNQYPVSTIEALQAMNPEAIQAFNRKYGSVAIPQNCQSQGSKLTPNGIYHYSWMGNRQGTNSLDAIESTVVTLGSSFLKGEANDGALPLCSGRYGQIIRQDYAHNHFDEVNQFFGILGPLRRIRSPCIANMPTGSNCKAYKSLIFMNRSSLLIKNLGN